MRKTGIHLGLTSLAFILAAATASPALAENGPEPSHNWVGAGYFWQNSDTPEVSDPQGFAVAGAFEPTNRLVLELSLERATAKLDPAIADIQATGEALVGTVGTYVPLSQRVQLVFSGGVDYERVTLEGEGDRLQEGQWFASATAGIVAKPTNRLELGASIQRLEAISDSAQGESRFVGRVDASYAITANVDLATSIGYEGGEPAVIGGLRMRF